MRTWLQSRPHLMWLGSAVLWVLTVRYMFDAETWPWRVFMFAASLGYWHAAAKWWRQT